MPQFTVISRDSHIGKKWQRFKGYSFASTSALAPIVGVEIARAALAMPLAFLQEANRFALMAVLSLTPGRNMLVAPAECLAVATGETSMRRKILAVAAALALGTAMMATGAVAGHGGGGGGGHASRRCGSST